MIWSHVTGWVMSRPASSATDLRYQRTWVLAHSGATTSWSFQVAPSTAPCSTPSDRAAWASAGNGASAPASANSAVNTGSRLIRSIDGSSADRRRSSWIRCSDALVGSSSVLIVYSSVLQRSAIPACPKAPPNPAGGLGSGLMYHVRVGIPPSDPHPARSSGPARAAAVTRPAQRLVARRPNHL